MELPLLLLLLSFVVLVHFPWVSSTSTFVFGPPWFLHNLGTKNMDNPITLNCTTTKTDSNSDNITLNKVLRLSRETPNKFYVPLLNGTSQVRVVCSLEDSHNCRAKDFVLMDSWGEHLYCLNSCCYFIFADGKISVSKENLRWDNSYLYHIPPPPTDMEYFATYPVPKVIQQPIPQYKWYDPCRWLRTCKPPPPKWVAYTN